MELGKVPPHDLEAEQAILGSMLTDKDVVIASIEVLKEEDFYREDNKTIYTAILNLYTRAEPIDIITVKSELESMGKLNQIGGLEYLVQLPEKVPTTANALKYIKIVEEKSTLRTLIKVANEIINGNKKMLEKYIRFLSTGSDIWTIDVFKILGIDLTDKNIYLNAIEYFNKLLKEYEQIYYYKEVNV